MPHRMLASSSIAILGIGLMLAPVEAFARGGGFAAPRALSAPGGIRPPALRIHHARTAPLHHRRWFRYGLPLAMWGTPTWYGVPDSPASYPMPNEEPLDDLSAYPTAGTGPTPRHISVIARPPTCNSQTMKVRSESGGERAITVTRC